MSGTSIYKSEAGKAAVLALYDRLLAGLQIPVEETMVTTHYGVTHVLMAGPADAPPVMFLHGGNSLNPGDLAGIVSLTGSYRVYAPDLIGQPGKSAETRLSPNSADFGLWLVNVLDALRLTTLPVIGCSFGAAIALRLAEVAPQRIARAALYVPGGIINMPLRVMVSMGIAYVQEMLFPARQHLVRGTGQLVGGEPADATLLEQLNVVFEHIRIEMNMPHATAKARLQGLTAPVMVIAGECDAIFPAQAVLARSQTLFPNLAAAEILPGSPHYVTGRHSIELSNRIQRFLEAA